MLRRSLLAASLPLLAGVASAQLPPFGQSPLTTSLGNAVSDLLDPSFEAVASGDFDANLDTDIVYLVDGDVVVAMNVVTSSSWFKISGRNVNDLAARRREDGKNVLVLAEPDQLSVVDFTFDWPTNSVSMNVECMTDLALRDLVAIANANLDGMGTADLVGIRAGGHDLVALLGDPVPDSGLTLFQGWGPQTGGFAWDLLRIDHDSDGWPEIVALTSNGLEFFGVAGNSLGVHPFMAVTGAITTLKGSGGEHVAWARPDGAGGSELVITHATYIGSPIDLGSVEVVGATSADLDGDDDEDLAFTLKDSSNLLLAENENGTVQTEYLRFVINGHTPTTDNEAHPLAVDINGDFEPDLAWASWNTGTLEVFYNEEYYGWQHMAPQLYYINLQYQQSTGEAIWDFGPAYSHWPGPPEATHVQVRLFNQFPSPTSGWNPPQTVPPVPFATVYTRIGVGGPATDIVFPLLDPAVAPTADFATFVEARYVVKSGGEITEVFPPTRIVLFGEDNQAALGYYLNFFQGAIYQLLHIIGLGGGNGVGGGSPPNNDPMSGP